MNEDENKVEDAEAVAETTEGAETSEESTDEAEEGEAVATE